MRRGRSRGSAPAEHVGVSGAIADGVLACRARARFPSARAPGRSRGGGCCRNRIAMVMLGVLVVIVARVPRARRSTRTTSRTPIRSSSNLDGTTIVNGKTRAGDAASDDRARARRRRRSARPGIRPLLPRRRRPGPRRRGPAALRRPQLAADRHRGGAHHLLHRDDRSASSPASSAASLDGVLSRLLDVVWAFPVYLLAISLSTVLLDAAASRSGRSTSQSGSLLLPILIIGVVYIPYVARPIRGEVLSLRRREFVEAAMGSARRPGALLWSDILPNVVTTVIVFFPLMIAIDMLTEAALSFLSIGVQPPDASWGTIILDGQGAALHAARRSRSRPGIAIAVTVLALNVLGDGVRDALDPRAKLAEAATDAALRRPPARLDGVRPLRDQRADVPDLLRDAGRRPGRAHRRAQRRPADAEARCGTTSGSTGRCPSGTR